MATPQSLFKEVHLQRAVALDLGLRRRRGELQFTHIPNELAIKGAAARRDRFHAKQAGMTAGSPDFVIWLAHGVVLAVELKVGNSAWRQSQKDFCSSLTALGHLYRLVRARTPDEAVALVGDALGEAPEAFERFRHSIRRN